MDRCFVHGLGMMTALGLTAESTWSGICGGKSGLALYERCDDLGMTVQARLPAELPKITWPKENRKKGNISGPFQQVTAECLRQIKIPQMSDCRIGLSVAVDPVSAQSDNGNVLSINPVNQALMIPYFQNWRVSFNGPVIGSISNCAAGLDAIGNAYEQMQLNNADMMLAGGSQVLRDNCLETAFRDLNATTSCTDPGRAVLPFDRKRSGTALGEGGAFFLLWREWSVDCLCEIVSFARGTEQYALTEHNPSGQGVSEVFLRALSKANLRPSDIGYVNVHGTGTIKNDPVEANGMRRVWGTNLDRTYFGATKQATGHLNYAAGAVEAAFVALALRDQVIPPHLFLEERDELFDAFLVPDPCGAKKANLEYAATISLGFGGFISVMIMKKV